MTIILDIDVALAHAASVFRHAEWETAWQALTGQDWRVARMSSLDDSRPARVSIRLGRGRYAEYMTSVTVEGRPLPCSGVSISTDRTRPCVVLTLPFDHCDIVS